MRTIDTDVVIVGAGPAGIFCALSLLERGFTGRIVMVDKGLAVEDRVCPKQAGAPCANCEPCRITTGFSGAGAFSDGKLSLSADVGGDLPDLIGRDEAQDAIGEVDGVYLGFGADVRVEGAERKPEVDEIRRRAIKAGLKLVDCPLRHLGTERARDLYARIERHLREAGVDLLFRTECTQVLIEGERCRGVAVAGPDGACEIRARRTVVATGRRGADWLERMCREHAIAHAPGPVDIGVRVEVRNEVMETVNDVLYESKLIGYPRPFKNKVRTFCQNPGGFVSQENYDGGLAVVNGHSYKERKSPNTNLAILCSQNFSHPFDQPIAYAQKVGELTNMLGDGRILVQRLGDIFDGKRTWEKELVRSNVAPTLDQHPQFHAGRRRGGAGVRSAGDASVLSRAQVLQQPRQDGRTLPDERMRPYVPRRFQRMDARAHDGQRHGLASRACRGRGAVNRQDASRTPFA